MQFYPAENGSRYSNGPFILQPNLNGTTAHVRPINVGPGRECHLRAAYLNRVELSSFIPRGPLAPSFPSRLSSSSPLHAVTRDRPAGMDAAAAAEEEEEGEVVASQRGAARRPCRPPTTTPRPASCE
jgi:hypothetical protein